ncbi:MAG: phage holin family protein [Alcanivorax sp.]|nr:phage holin family protein [Alcanivorax sp.]
MVQKEKGPDGAPEPVPPIQENDPAASAGERPEDVAEPAEGPSSRRQGDFRLIAEDASGLARDMLALFVAELRLSLSTVLVMVALAAMSGLLLAGAFIFLGGSAAWILVTAGLSGPVVAGLLLVAFLLIMTWLAYIWARRLSRDLMFGGTRSALHALTALRWTLPEEKQSDTQTDSGSTPGGSRTAESDRPQDGAQRSSD